MSEFIPLSEIDSSVCNLPVHGSVDPNRIGVNMERIASIAANGCFKADTLRIVSYEGSASQEAMGISGHDGSTAFGTAVSRMSKASAADSEITGGRSERQLDYRTSGNLTLRLNGVEITQKVQRSNLPIREPEAWTKHIDHALRKEFTAAAWRNAFSRPSSSEVVFESMSAGLMAGVLTLDVFNTTSMPGRIAFGLLCTTVMGSMDPIYMAKREGHRWQESRFSMVPFFPVDRAALVTARLACSQLVKTI